MCISEVLFFSLEQNLSASPSSHLVEFQGPEPAYYNLGPPSSHAITSMRQNTRHRSTGDVTFKKNKSLLLFRLYHQELCGRVGLGRRGSRGPRLHLSLWFPPSAAVGLQILICTRHGCALSLKRTLTHTCTKADRRPTEPPKDGSFLFLKQF